MCGEAGNEQYLAAEDGYGKRIATRGGIGVDRRHGFTIGSLRWLYWLLGGLQCIAISSMRNARQRWDGLWKVGGLGKPGACLLVLILDAPALPVPRPRHAAI